MQINKCMTWYGCDVHYKQLSLEQYMPFRNANNFKLIRQASCFYLSKRKQAKSSSRIIPILFSSTKSTCKTTPDLFNYSAFCLTCISLLLCIPIPQQQLRARSIHWFLESPAYSVFNVQIHTRFRFLLLFLLCLYMCVCILYIFNKCCETGVYFIT